MLRLMFLMLSGLMAFAVPSVVRSSNSGFDGFASTLKDVTNSGRTAQDLKADSHNKVRELLALDATRFTAQQQRELSELFDYYVTHNQPKEELDATLTMIEDKMQNVAVAVLKKF